MEKNARQPDLDSPATRLTVHYVLALVVVGLLVLVNQQILQAGLDSRLRDESVVGLIRRQRTLSQKMTKAAVAAQVAADDSERRQRQLELDEAYRELVRNHLALREGDPQLQLSGRFSPAVRDAFASVEPQFEALRTGAEQLLIRLNENPFTLDNDERATLAIRKLLLAEPVFLARVEQLADRFSQESAERLKNLTETSQMLLGLMLATLLFQGGFIFHPAARRIRENFISLREAARSLARSEETFRRSFENAAVGMTRTSLDGRAQIVNGALSRFLDVPEPEMLNVPLQDWALPGDREKLNALARRIVDGEAEVAEAEIRFIHRDGHPRWALASVSAARDDHGLPLYLIWQILDNTERHRSMEAEYKARAFAEAIVDTVREPLVVLEGDLRIRAVNRSFAESFQLPPDEVVGHRFHEIGMGEWTMPGLVTKLEDALREDAPLHDHEISDNFPAVGHRIMLINARRMGVREGDGMPEAILVAMEDITDRRRAEQALRSSERRYRLMAANATDLITRHSPEGDCLYASPACVQLLGCEQGELLGNGMFSKIDPEDERHLREAFSLLVDEGVQTTTVYRIRRPNGGHLWFETRARLVRDEENRTDREGDPDFLPTEIVAVSRDVTSRQQAEDALRQSNALVSAILESITDAFISIDRNWRCTYLNSEAERVLGLSRTEVLGRTVWQDPDQGPASSLRHKCAVALEHNAPVEFEEYDPVHDAWYEVKVYPSRIGFSVYLRDITERHRAEQMVRKLNRDLQARTSELEVTNHELEAFSYSVSHDLRAPLRSIDGFSRALQEDYGEHFDEAGRDYLNRVRRATQRMGHLIDALLNLSRVTRADLTVEKVDLASLARAVAEDLAESDPARTVTFEISPGLQAHADPRLLRIALENLLGNAYKFTSRRGEARIVFGSFRESPDAPEVFFVRDNGAGFDMQYADKLFGAFQRLHGSDEFAGTGIGLATVQRIIRRHGGRVWAQGEVDRGATIYFTLAPGPVKVRYQEQLTS